MNHTRFFKTLLFSMFLTLTTSVTFASLAQASCNVQPVDAASVGAQGYSGTVYAIYDQSGTYKGFISNYDQAVAWAQQRDYCSQDYQCSVQPVDAASIGAQGYSGTVYAAYDRTGSYIGFTTTCAGTLAWAVKQSTWCPMTYPPYNPCQ